ncbi:MAG: hypothetical protein Q9190_000015 [Brigantiaea leucoxantha]
MRLYSQLSPSSGNPSFRLLEIAEVNSEASAIEDVIRATVETYDLQGGNEYSAVSYAWGPKDESASISLNGELIIISKALLLALQHLRLEQRGAASRTKLWVDALCINQLDNEERSRQVLLMRDIYALAIDVRAWIGEPDTTTALAFDTLERFAAEDGTRDGSATCQSLQDTVEVRRRAIQLFLQRPYFSRMWIVQELVVARRASILCGLLSIDFDKMYIAVQRMTGSQFYPFSTATSNITYVGNWRASYSNMSAQEKEENFDVRLFMDFRDRRATDARDKIFSLRGITNKALAAGITVNYTNSVKSVYTGFSKYALSTRPDLQVLSSVYYRHRQYSTFRLPSYVPDWSLPTYAAGVLQRYHRFQKSRLFRTAGATTPCVRIEEHNDAVSLKGIRFGTVQAIIPIEKILFSDEDGSLFIDETKLRKLAAEITAHETYRFTGEPSWIACFRSLTADRTALSPRVSDEYRSRFLTSFSDWSLNEHERHLSPLAWMEVSKVLNGIIEDKDMFLTDEGYLGLGPQGLHKDDVVCIFSGGETPFLIRTAPAGKERIFEFVSECYIHGIMDGEAMDGSEASRWEYFTIE